MNRLASYIGIIAALSLGIFMASLFDSQTMLHTLTTTSSSTLSVIPSTSPLPPEEGGGASVTPSVTTIPKKKTTPPPTVTPVITSAPPVAKPISTPTPSPTPVTTEALDASASVLRNALVNIICYAPQGSVLHSISGSGVFIDPKGIILTNAHIAQYFLFANQGISCAIRSGGPAIDKYTAALIYISPLWIKENASLLTQSTPSGTGEYDFALLAVTKSSTSAPVPAQFPFIPLAQEPPLPGTPIVIGSYGAQFLGSNQVQSSLFPTIVFGSIKKVYTFVRTTIDVLALGGSAAAQEGSSGGGVANALGMLVGTITTSTIEGDTSTRSLSAITASYIRAEYASESGKALDLLLTEPTSISIANFASRIPALEAMLEAHLP